MNEEIRFCTAIEIQRTQSSFLAFDNVFPCLDGGVEKRCFNLIRERDGGEKKASSICRVAKQTAFPEFQFNCTVSFRDLDLR
jgi:hypothetical protein